MANLTQLRMLEDLDGFLLVDKPEGLPFTTVVKTVKRNFNLVKVGHGGSLDALASGLLVLLLNDANKFVDRVMGADRAYEGTFRLGRKTNTGDVRGTPVGAPCADASFAAFRAALDRALPRFRGDVFQVEPRYCTVRKEGSSDYEIADTGEHRPFLAHVYRLDVAPSEAAGDMAAFALVASKGLIVRSLVDDLGDAVGCGAALSSVRRTRIGRFDVADAVPFQKLLETDIRDFAALVRPIAQVL